MRNFNLLFTIITFKCCAKSTALLEFLLKLEYLFRKSSMHAKMLIFPYRENQFFPLPKCWQWQCYLNTKSVIQIIIFPMTSTNGVSYKVPCVLTQLILQLKKIPNIHNFLIKPHTNYLIIHWGINVFNKI